MVDLMLNIIKFKPVYFTVFVTVFFLISLILWFLPNDFIEINYTNLIFANLILLVSSIIHKFSIRYMYGDKNYQGFYYNLFLLTLSLLCFVTSDNLVALIATWAAANIFLVLLMMHKQEWIAAKNAALYALYNFILAGGFLVVAVFILYFKYHSLSLTDIIYLSKNDNNFIPMLCIIVTAIIQSAQWPFNKWLLSSLNSPTPVSAMMHAGLINGGGILLIKFAPMLLDSKHLLDLIFVTGFISAFIGTFFKLIQSDVKKMLTCSTMAQMGFMFMQCGLGLFTSAVAHIVLHSLFKANLFLGAGCVLDEKRRQQNRHKNFHLLSIFPVIIAGVIGAYGFIIGLHKHVLLVDTSLVLIGFAAISAISLANTILSSGNLKKKFIPTIGLCFILGYFYGLNVYLFEFLLAGYHLQSPQALGYIHIIACMIMFAAWIINNIIPSDRLMQSAIAQKLYVYMLNGSQAKENTITALRANYKY